jgi:hypothetical protein
MKWFAISTLVWFASASAVLSMNSPALAQDAATADDAADIGFLELDDMVTPDTAEELGFDPNTAGSDGAELDKHSPLRVFVVDLNDLRQFKSGNDPEKLLKNPNITIYPITIRGKVRSSVTVELSVTNQKWSAIAWGAPDLIRGLTNNRKPESRVVYIPALNLYFVGGYENMQLVLTPIRDLRKFKLKAGVWVPARDVFSRLLPAAKSRKPAEPG